MFKLLLLTWLCFVFSECDLGEPKPLGENGHQERESRFLSFGNGEDEVDYQSVLDHLRYDLDKKCDGSICEDSLDQLKKVDDQLEEHSDDLKDILNEIGDITKMIDPCGRHLRRKSRWRRSVNLSIRQILDQTRIHGLDKSKTSDINDIRALTDDQVKEILAAFGLLNGLEDIPLNLGLRSLTEEQLDQILVQEGIVGKQGESTRLFSSSDVMAIVMGIIDRIPSLATSTSTATTALLNRNQRTGGINALLTALQGLPGTASASALLEIIEIIAGQIYTSTGTSTGTCTATCLCDGRNRLCTSSCMCSGSVSTIVQCMGTCSSLTFGTNVPCISTSTCPGTGTPVGGHSVLAAIAGLSGLLGLTGIGGVGGLTGLTGLLGLLGNKPGGGMGEADHCASMLCC